jgi:very-short-patch-repair endonuclease
MPPSETLTGGKASVRVLRNLGYEGLYEKIEGIKSRNPVKNARRNALKDILEKNFGKVETEKTFAGIQIPDLDNRHTMDKALRSILDKIESVRGMTVKGQPRRLLSFDYYLPSKKVVIEFDERQHFTLPRAASLQAYPDGKKLSFDKEKWIQLCHEINAGDNSPAYRDEQRAFYDAVRDIMASRIGLQPVVRIYEADVLWEKEGDSSPQAKKVLNQIKRTK